MLKNARERKGLTQEYLAHKLNITQAYLSKLENGKKYNGNVTIDLIRKISVELDVDPVNVFLYFYYNEDKAEEVLND